MAKWLAVCSKCGYRVEGNLPDGECPECGAASWLCRLLDLPATHKPWRPSEPSSFAHDDAITSENSCNKITGGIKHRAGRPRADIPLGKVMAMASEGMTLRAIADELDVSHMTIKRILSGQRVLLG